MINLIHGDCLVAMKNIPDKSIDMILCDLPYGTTACKWDVIIPFEPLWEQYKRVIKDNGAIVLFGSEPFSSKLRMSNIEWYRYDYVWEKTKASNFASARKIPMKYHENISVFYKKYPTYNLHNLTKLNKPIKNSRKHKGANLGHYSNGSGEYYQIETGFHRSILKFSNPSGAGHPHPTAKPVALLEHLIKTYSNEGETILDNTMGSGSTGVAAKLLNRNFIGIELNEEYFKIAQQRIANTQPRLL